MGTRPRLACEVCAEGVVAARAEDASAVLSAISLVELAEEVAVPRLHAVDAASAILGSSASRMGPVRCPSRRATTRARARCRLANFRDTIDPRMLPMLRAVRCKLAIVIDSPINVRCVPCGQSDFG